MRSLDMAIYGYESQVVYVMVADYTHTVKIGISGKPGARMNNVQTGSAANVTIYWAGRVPKADARKVERAAHNLMKSEGRHIRGEWFQSGADYARGVVIRAAEIVGVPIKDDINYDMRHRG